MNKTINTAINQKPSVQTRNMKKLAKKVNDDYSNKSNNIDKDQTLNYNYQNNQDNLFQPKPSGLFGFTTQPTRPQPQTGSSFVQQTNQNNMFRNNAISQNNGGIFGSSNANPFDASHPPLSNSSYVNPIGLFGSHNVSHQSHQSHQPSGFSNVPQPVVGPFSANNTSGMIGDSIVQPVVGPFSANNTGGMFGSSNVQPVVSAFSANNTCGMFGGFNAPIQQMSRPKQGMGLFGSSDTAQIQERLNQSQAIIEQRTVLEKLKQVSADQQFGQNSMHGYVSNKTMENYLRYSNNDKSNEILKLKQIILNLIRKIHQGNVLKEMQDYFVVRVGNDIKLIKTQDGEEASETIIKLKHQKQ